MERKENSRSSGQAADRGRKARRARKKDATKQVAAMPRTDERGLGGEQYRAGGEKREKRKTRTASVAGRRHDRKKKTQA